MAPCWTGARAALVAITLGVLACGAGTPASAPAPAAGSPPPPQAAQLSRPGELDAMCACRDAACADRVHARFAGPGDARDAHLAACERQARIVDELPTMHAMRDAVCACKDAACVGRVNQQYAAFLQREQDAFSVSDDRPTAEVMQASEERAACAAAVADQSAQATAQTASVTGLAECDAYLHAFERMMACDKIPQQARDASRQAIEQMKTGWQAFGAPGVAPEARKAAGDACKQAVDALAQSAQAMGCPL